MLGLSREPGVSVKIVQLLRPPTADQATVDAMGEELIEWDCYEDLSEELPVAGGLKSNTPGKVFEKVFLGETFSCFALVTNGTKETIAELSLNVDIQTSQRRCSVGLSYREPMTHLESGASLRAFFAHEVTEIGQHLLICSLGYTQAGGKATCRKLYKFPVLKPLDVHTKFYDRTDEVYMEAHVQNTTDDDMIMERIALEPGEGLMLAPLITNPLDDRNSSGWLIRPECMRQFLYGLKFRSEETSSRANRGLITVGKLSMVWRTSRGRRGRLQTCPLERMITGCGDLKMTVVKSPNVVKIQQPFTITCRITNCCDRVLELSLTLENDLQSGFVWNSKSRQKVASLSPASSADLNFTLIPISSGLKCVSGMQFQDAATKRTYEPDEVAQVFVYT
uniref:Trafficking protein particle complex subunit 13 n=1 Tax=Trichuris muris TaxID=70415 RepID=A0A5S6QGD3_TRIMR